MKKILLTSAMAALLAVPASLFAVDGKGSSFDANNVTCRGLTRARCAVAARCKWREATGSRKAACIHRGGAASDCAGLRRPACAIKPRCRWVEKTDRRRAYCRLR